MNVPRLPLLPIGPMKPIPPTLHRIWVGPSDEVPYWVRASWERWDQFLDQSVHTWTTYEWTNSSVRGTPLERAVRVAEYYDLPPRGQADLLRVMAVSLYGGWYMDADVVPLRSLDDMTSHPHVSGWTTSHAESREQKVLWNGGFGFGRGHAYLARILDFADEGLQRGLKNEHFLAGPRAYRKFLSDDIITEWDFQFEASAEERRIMAAGGEFDYEDLRRKYPARLKHIGPRED